MTTQNCAECGTRAEPGQSFCDACGAVLSWEQAGAARTAQPAAATSDRGPAFDAFGGAGVPPARTGRPAPAPAADGTAEPATGTIGDNPTLPQPRRTAGAAGTPDTGGTAAPGDTPGDPDRAAGSADRSGPSGRSDQPGQPDPSAQSAQAAQAGQSGPPGTTAGNGAPATDETAPTAPVPAAAAAPAPAPAPNALSDTMSDRARSLLVPVADPEAPAPTPPPAVAPVLPGRPDADRPQVRAPGHQPDIANGPPCPWCSTPNRPDRHYCARCAMPLVASGDQATVRAPWWRRLFGGRRRETPWAGDRPRLRRVFDRIGTWITVAVVATLAVLGFMYIPDGIQNTRDHFAKRAPVSPDGIKASRSFPGHKPELLIDKLSNTWWGPGISESGKGEWIEATFTEPTRLLDVIITPGVSSSANKLQESALPHRIKATITMKDGSIKTRDLTLDQGAGGQRRPFRVGEVTKVRFTIESAHAASAEKQVAIAEIEFFGPSSANRSS
ncbi:zinc ribbon domain-containing protein [Streptomyces coelicoflavus]|uniref:NADase-type glycan-binding domain-containing protein n=1 Tax=Streptomyces coelicoflavus TaxID=285562 RepID=UPI0024ADD265|nr:zinc ribbon domain-containing protein [Streptomyces coelicoflavus]MDI6518868.1 zinc ribbon domain-containing protein [Streptomyces coelicoflavus]